MFKNPLTKAAGSPSRSSRQPWILRLRIASIIATIAITALPSATAHADYGPKTRMFDWNSAGGAQLGDRNDWLEATLQSYIINRGANYPGIVILQEVCRRQAEDVQGFMYGKGYGYFSFYTAQQDEGSCGVSFDTGTNRRNFGNAVWVWGAQQGSQWASPSFPHQFDASGEKRGMACIWPTPYQVQACSFHLTPYSRAAADCQFRDAMYWIENAYASGKRTVFGADLNIPSFSIHALCYGFSSPSQLAYTYNTYHEADQYSGTDNQVTHSDGAKIDYVFIKKGWGGYFADLSVTTSASDHKLLEAFLSW